ncbi:MAG: SHOCT domain-containing protein [Acidimicrobiales bacterium]
MSKADELAKLDALRQSGVLTQEEFDAEKAELLGRFVAPPAAEVPLPRGSEAPQGDGSWQATDGKWYAAELHPDYRLPSAPSLSPAEARMPSPPGSRAQPTFSAPTTRVADEKQYNNKTFPVVLGILVLVGIAIGIVFLVNGSSRSSQNTAAKSNLQNALLGAKTYFTENNQTYAGLTTPSSSTSDIQQIGTGLAWVPATTTSTGPGTISSRVIGGGSAVVLTAYAPSSGICYGILDVTTTQAHPPFAGYPQSAAPGTYFFSNLQPSPGDCKASVTTADALSPGGW